MSRPLQVILLGAVLFLAVWFVALRPKGDSSGGGSSTPAKPAAQQPAQGSTSPATGPGKSVPGGLGRAVTKARSAAGQSDAANQRVQHATGGATSAPAPSTAAAAKAATPAAAGRGATGAGFGLPSNNAAASSLVVAAGMISAGVAGAAGLDVSALVGARGTGAVTPANARRTVQTKVNTALPSRATASPSAVRAAMSTGKIVVLLFWNARGADDKLVHGEVAHVSSHNGRALIVSAPVRDVSRYSSLIRGIQVLQSPTVLVIDHSHHARTLVGYTDRAEIGQSVSDAIAGR